MPFISLWRISDQFPVCTPCRWATGVKITKEVINRRNILLKTRSATDSSKALNFNFFNFQLRRLYESFQKLKSYVSASDAIFVTTVYFSPLIFYQSRSIKDTTSRIFTFWYFIDNCYVSSER